MRSLQTNAEHLAGITDTYGKRFRYGNDTPRGPNCGNPTEARQAEPGPSVLALLTISTALAVLILGIVWFVFFRT